MSIFQRKNKQGQGNDVSVHVQFMIDRLYLLLQLETHFEGDSDLRYQAWMYKQVLDGLLADQAFHPAMESSYAGLAGWNTLQGFVDQCVQASDMGFYDGEIVVSQGYEDYETEVVYSIEHCDWSDASAGELPIVQQWYREGFHAAWYNPVEYRSTTPSPYESPQDGRM